VKPLVSLFVVGGALAASASGASGGGARACVLADYGLHVSVAKARKGVAVDVAVASMAVPTCRVRTTIRLEIGIAGAKVRRQWTLSRPVPFWAPVAHRWLLTSWCGPRRGLRATATAPADHAFVKLRSPPRCRGGRTRLADAGPTWVRPCCGVIPARFLTPETPVPISPARLRVKNDWLVANGVTHVAVYAGEAGNDPTVGSFGIVRQNGVFGYQTTTFVDVPGVGAVTITSAPTGRAVLTSAQHADLGFSTKSGTRGVLHLATDRAELAPQQATQPARPRL
jgi:hypothetical protein